jgi:hypothetical protein
MASEIPADMWGKLEMVMEFIRDNVKSTQLEDPANSNNIVSATMTDFEKDLLARDMETMLLQINEDEENLRIYFPLNHQFNSEEEKKKLAALEMAREGVVSKPWLKY